MFKGSAELKSTKNFLDQAQEKGLIHPTQRKIFNGVEVSSLALGTYLGAIDEVTDLKVTQAALHAFDLGCNFIDTAINYRGQRAEKSIGEALKRAFLTKKLKREEIFISTKAGFIPFEGQVANPKAYFFEHYVNEGLARESDLVSECHCMAPLYIENQIERSLRNLGLETIDLFYLHNPETQLEEVPARVFYEKLLEAFEVLEKSVSLGKIRAYGLATWSAFREASETQFSVQLEKVLEVARAASQKVNGTTDHHCKAIQLPFNLAMAEAAFLPTQTWEGKRVSALEAAERAGLSVAVSVPLFQGRLCHGLPEFLMEKFPAEFSQAHAALAFATSFPGVTSAMLGMKQSDHVQHNLEFLQKPALTQDQLKNVLSSMVRRS